MSRSFTTALAQIPGPARPAAATFVDTTRRLRHAFDRIDATEPATPAGRVADQNASRLLGQLDRATDVLALDHGLTTTQIEDLRHTA